MYLIHNHTDSTTTMSDTLVLVRLHANGCYVQADPSEAQGFTAMIPVEYETPVLDAEGNETGETEVVKTVQTQVYIYEGQQMKGDEPVGSWEETPAVPQIVELEDDLEQAYELLYGGDEQ